MIFLPDHEKNGMRAPEKILIQKENDFFILQDENTLC